MSKNYACVMDVGGTNLKSALINDELEIIGEIHCTPIYSKLGKEYILETFAKALAIPLEIAKINHYHISGIGIAACGPFDYANGICLMQRDKYTSIYNVNVKEELGQRLNFDKSKILFKYSDSQYFLIGETCQGLSKQYKSIIGVTIGTGVGSSFLKNGEIILYGTTDKIPNHSIGLLPYNDKRIEDYIAKDGLMNRFKELENTQVFAEVKDIEIHARNGNRKARQTFQELGTILGKTLLPFVHSMKAELIILGGNIAKGFDLFEAPLAEELKGCPTLKKVMKAQNLEKSTLIGAGYVVLKLEK